MRVYEGVYGVQKVCIYGSANLNLAALPERLTHVYLP